MPIQIPNNMKSKWMLLALVGITFIACSKKEQQTVTDAQDSLVVNSDSLTVADSLLSPDGFTMEPGVFRYIAFDGTNSEVTFSTTGEGNFLKLRGGQLTLELPQVDSSDSTAIFRDHDIEARAFGDSLIIEQGANLFELKKARVQ